MPDRIVDVVLNREFGSSVLAHARQKCKAEKEG